ncbi:unnamed protein product [Penicillium camemberti]|uniref:Str. FM013 n=1 Tax=Penicillium camemberti (strain FM 013) TaxID=1429867 RepID=A0A0G4PWH0_PENC3|nr:unnamed protein product [Penicillium camemberti]
MGWRLWQTVTFDFSPYSNDPGHKKGRLHQSNTSHEREPTQVRFRDGDPGDDPRDSNQGGSISGPQKKSEGSARVQTRSTNPNLTAVRAQWNSGLCYLGGIAGAGEYLEYHTEVWQQRSDSRFSCPRKRVIGPPSRGKLLLSLSGLWNVLEAIPSVLHLPRRKYTLFEPDPSSPYMLQLDRQSANFSR